MRALGIALAVLAMTLTSGGIAYQSSADLASAGSGSDSLDLDAGQCRVDKPGLAILELPNTTER